MKILSLKLIGIDDFSQPTYRDQYGRLWKDLNLGESEVPDLYSVSGNDIDGEPSHPINQAYVFDPEPYRRSRYESQYMMLGRLRSDCEYYLGYGNRNASRLYYGEPKQHIARMKELWNSFPDGAKPRWLTWEQILEYEEAMTGRRQMRISKKTVKQWVDVEVEQYIAEDGKVFDTAKECKAHDELCRNVKSLELPYYEKPLDCEDDVDDWRFLWYKVHTDYDLFALEDYYGISFSGKNRQDILSENKVCLQTGDFYAGVWVYTIPEDIAYVTAYFNNLGYDVKITKKSEVAEDE